MNDHLSPRKFLKIWEDEKERDKYIRERIAYYHPKNGLDSVALYFLNQSSINHILVRHHSERVAMLAEKIAEKEKMDTLAEFFCGLLHDNAKVTEPGSLYDGHNVSPEEYEEIKNHARYGFMALNGVHTFCALCAGFHHGLYPGGYGIGMKDIPQYLSPATVKKLLDVTGVVSICDFVDANLHRKTEILDGSNAKSSDLRDMLYNKYPNDIMTIDIALSIVGR